MLGAGSSELLVFLLQAGSGTLIMAAGVQDFNRTEFDRLNEIKGHLEIALLEKHFLREYPRVGRFGGNAVPRTCSGVLGLVTPPASCHRARSHWGQAWPRVTSAEEAPSAALVRARREVFTLGKGQCPREAIKGSLGILLLLVDLVCCNPGGQLRTQQSLHSMLCVVSHRGGRGSLRGSSLGGRPPRYVGRCCSHSRPLPLGFSCVEMVGTAVETSASSLHR